ncbi:MAG: amylosucrase [Lachnospiraceae bacterium]|nr:amylosucrase [Lachnospiraceae bacterium]
MSDERVFQDRLSWHYDELKWLYGELYHSDEHAFEYFVSVLRDAYLSRPDVLIERDESREFDADWYKKPDMIGIQMYAENFGGDLRGVCKHLDYVASCGVKYIHLMPPYDCQEGKNDGGYAVSDYRNVRKSLGTTEDLSLLVEECHKRRICVCLDLVTNHTGDEHEWARLAKEGNRDYQNRYFMYDDWYIPNLFDETVPNTVPQMSPGNFTWCEEARKVVMTTFYPYQWDLNYQNPTVFNDMTSELLYICNLGADIVRLDAIPYIWKSLGTDCRNLPQVHTILRMMRMAVEIVCPGILLMGEVTMDPGNVMQYFGTYDKPECHMLCNSLTMAGIWNSVATMDVRLLKHQMESFNNAAKDHVFLNYLRCHDDISWYLDFDYLRQLGIEEDAHKNYLNEYLKGSWPGSVSKGAVFGDHTRPANAGICGTTASLCGIETAAESGDAQKMEDAVRLDIMLHAYILTLSGIPVLYSGDEVGQLNDRSYENDPDKKDDPRYIHRGKFNWASPKRRFEKGTVEEKIAGALAVMETIRQGHRVFDFGADVWILETWNDKVLGVGRYYNGEKLLALFNFGDSREIAWIDEAEPYTDLFTDRFMEAKAVELPARGFVWMVTTF